MRADRIGDAVGHVIVEGQDHQRVLAGTRAGKVHRADVHVGLAEHDADPPDRARTVHVPGDEHDLGGGHVEAVVVEAGDPRLATRDRAGHGRRHAASLGRERQLGGERPGVGRLALDERDPAGLGQGAGVDEVDPLHRAVLEQAAEDRGGERRAVERGEVAGDLEGQGLEAAPREFGEEAPEDLGERQVWRDRPGRLRRQERRVDRVPGAAALEHVEDLRGDLLGHEDLGLGGRRPQVRREQRVRRVEERGSGRWLVVEDVDPRATEVAGPERVGDRRLVEDAATGDVEHDRPRLQLRDGRLADQSARRARQRDVDGHDIGSPQQLVHLDELDAVVGRLLRGDERVDAEDRHLHRPGADRDGLPDLADARRCRGSGRAAPDP